MEHQQTQHKRRPSTGIGLCPLTESTTTTTGRSLRTPLLSREIQPQPYCRVSTAGHTHTQGLPKCQPEEWSTSSKIHQDQKIYQNQNGSQQSYRIQNKSTVFLCNSSQFSQIEIKKANPFSIATNLVNKLPLPGTNLTKKCKDLYNENYETLIKDTKKDINMKWHLTFIDRKNMVWLKCPCPNHLQSQYNPY